MWSSSLLAQQLSRAQLRPCQEPLSEVTLVLETLWEHPANIYVFIPSAMWIVWKVGAMWDDWVYILFTVESASTFNSQDKDTQCTFLFSFMSCVWEQEKESRSETSQLNYFAESLSPGNENNETESILLHNIYIATQQLWSASVGLFGQTAGCSSTVRRCYELWCSLQSWFLHLGLVKLNGVEHMQTNAFVLGDKAACLLQTCTHTQSAIVSPSSLLVTLYVKV